MKKALVLAGGFPQIELINQLKAREYTVILADYNEAPVAKKFADVYYQASTLDVPAILEIARKERVDFLITVCTDQALLTVAQVSELLGLPCYIDYQTALNVTNKQYMKDVFFRNGIQTAQHVILGELDEAAIAHMNYPLIVKPVDCNSSKGVRRAECLEELRGVFADAVRFSRTNTAIIEEFIDGEEITVDVYVENGKASVLSISNSDKIAEKDKFVIFRTIQPAAVNDDIRTQVAHIAQQVADAFGIVDSPMLIQMLTDGRKAYVIEFSARTGGGVKYLLIRHVSGFDVVKAVIDLTEGKKPSVQECAPRTKYLVNDFIYCKPGAFDHLEGFEELKNEGLMQDYYVFKWQGAEFDGVRSSGDRVGGYTVTADSPEELLRKHREIRSRIRVIDDHGADMTRHDLLTELKTDGTNIYSDKD